MNLRFGKDKKDKKLNYKVIAASIVAITLVGITGISIGRFYGSSPITADVVVDSVNSVAKTINKGFTFITEEVSDILKYRTNAKNMNKIMEENSELQNEVIELNKKLDKVESLENLKKGLKYVDESYKPNSIATRVVSKNDGNWYESVVLGAGKKDGVKTNSIVLNADGIVGLVYEVTENYSKAISLLDTKSSVSFELSKNTEYKGVLTESITLEDKEKYRQDGYLYGYVFDTEYEILPGDVITTSGMGIYPEGIPIGEVDKVTEDKNNSMKYVIVRPYVNFKNIDDVIIIEPRDIE